MAFANAQQSRLWLGNLRISAYSKGATLTWPTDMLDVSTLEDTAYQFIPGQDTSTWSTDLLFDTATGTNSLSEVLSNWKAGSDLPLTFCPAGTTAGSLAELVAGIETQLTPSSTPNAAVGLSVSAQTNGLTDFGIILDPSTGVTADGSSTAIDNAASSANGGVAHLHVTAFSGLTSDAIIIEHSTNNSVWATLGTFTTVTGVTNQRLVIAPGTTVNRYLRVTDDVTGTGTCTRVVAFARR